VEKEEVNIIVEKFIDKIPAPGFLWEDGGYKFFGYKCKNGDSTSKYNCIGSFVKKTKDDKYISQGCTFLKSLKDDELLTHKNNIILREK